MLLNEVKDWLRVDFDYDDNMISSLIEDAKAYIYNATGKVYDNDKRIHKRCLIFMVTQWYENREPTGKIDKMPFALESMLIQITYDSDEVVEIEPEPIEPEEPDNPDPVEPELDGDDI